MIFQPWSNSNHPNKTHPKVCNRDSKYDRSLSFICFWLNKFFTNYRVYCIKVLLICFIMICCSFCFCNVGFFIKLVIGFRSNTLIFIRFWWCIIVNRIVNVIIVIIVFFGDFKVIFTVFGNWFPACKVKKYIGELVIDISDNYMGIGQYGHNMFFSTRKSKEENWKSIKSMA